MARKPSASREFPLFPTIALYSHFLDLTARLSWINWENLGVNPVRRHVLSQAAGMPPPPPE